MRHPVLLCAALLTALPLPAQFWSEIANPKVDVRLLHPPELGLKVGRVAFSPTHYAISRELSDAMAGELSRDRRLEVVDPGRLASTEGSAVLVRVDVHRCRPVHTSTEKEAKDSKGVVTVTRTATTTLEFNATVQVVEPRSGQVLLTRKFEESPAKSNSSSSGAPLHPGDADLRRSSHAKVIDWLFRALLPWEETLRVTFFDDDAYLMDKAAARLKDGDARGALEWAVRGEAEARLDKGGKAKYRERAFYNLGVARMVLGDFEGARPRLQEAREMNTDAGIFRDTLRECQRALEVKLALDRWDRSAADPATPGSPRKDPEQRLLELDRLRKKGLITEEDYRRRKEEILREI
jgi:hypothetical protein